MSDVKRFLAPGPWITRDLKEVVLASDYDDLAARLAVEEAHGEKYQRELAELRTRLAEAEALLREIDDDLEIGAHPQLHRERIRAYFAPDSATTREDEHE